MLFEQYFKKNTNRTNTQIFETHYKNKFEKLKTGYIHDETNQHKKNLFLEKRIQFVFNNYCSM